MSTSNFTPGPWSVQTVPTSIGHAHRIHPVGACLYVDHRDEKHKDEKTITAAANARLIAAAPELLEALKSLASGDGQKEKYELLTTMETIDDQDARFCQAYEQVMAAIAKAEGQS